MSQQLELYRTTVWEAVDTSGRFLILASENVYSLYGSEEHFKDVRHNALKRLTQEEKVALGLPNA